MRPAKQKSRTFRRIAVTTPGGKMVTQYKKCKPSKAVCGKCKKQLAGVPRERPVKMRNMAKTKKRPERTYGGVLCSACLKRQIITKSRS